MLNHDPEKNFEELWKTFNDRYPFFEERNVDWKKQYETYRAKVTSKTGDDELFDIFCEMLGPLNDGHVSLIAKTSEDRERRFTPEKKPRFWREFTSQQQIEQLFQTTEKTLVANGLVNQSRLRRGFFTTVGSEALGICGSSRWKVLTGGH